MGTWAPAPAPSLEVGGLGVSADSLGAGFAAWGRVQVGWALLGQGLSQEGEVEVCSGGCREPLVLRVLVLMPGGSCVS